MANFIADWCEISDIKKTLLATAIEIIIQV